MNDRRVADYFVIAGLVDNAQKLHDNMNGVSNMKTNENGDPITDIGVVFPLLGESVPHDYTVLLRTPTGFSADLNSGSLRSTECFLCIRRGRDKPPLVDIGVLYEGKEFLMKDSEVVQESFGGLPANVSNSTNQKIFITYRRNRTKSACNLLVVTDVCIINTTRNESPPHTFCCIDRNLNKGIVGCDMFLCYKKSVNRPKLISYQPEVICRFPEKNLDKFLFPEIVPLFCLPMGVSLEVWPKDAVQPRPVFSTFVLTVSDAKQKVYGSALSFYEDFSANLLTKEQEILLEFDENSENSLHVNKSICVLSHWPFSDSFERWLYFLYEKIVSKRPLDIPIERYVVQLIDEVIFPNPRTLIQLSLNVLDRFMLSQPEDSPLPRSAAGFCYLLINLGSDNCIQLLLLALTEQKILIHSLRPDILTAIVEAVSSFLFPFKWQCPYIPLCPLNLAEVLHAPLPFLIGVDSKFFDLYDLPTGINCIDLDANNITLTAEQRYLITKMLPKKPTKTLKNTLNVLYEQIVNSRKQDVIQNSHREDGGANVNYEYEFQRKKRDHGFEVKIQEAFLRFMATILKGYRSYLLPITRTPTVGTTDAEALFQMNLFLRSRDKAYQKFFNMLMRTQMFIKFIEERSFVADGNQELEFFDDCIERLAFEESEIRLIERDSIQANDRTVLLMPPEPLTPESMFVYDHFELNPNLLTNLRKNSLHSKQFKLVPGSPLLRRTKQEIRTAKKIATKWSLTSDSWAKYLLGTCYSLHIMMLPNLLEKNGGREKTILCDSYELLMKANQLGLYCDEVCYRIMMQLCGENSIPLLAVKLLLLMKRSGIQPNALTYGLYNRCVLEAEWPAYSSSSQLLWNKLKYVIQAVSHFRKAIVKKDKDKMNSSIEGQSNLTDEVDKTSQLSLESKEDLIIQNSTEKLNRCGILKSDSSISQTNLFKNDDNENESQLIKPLDRALSMKLSDCLNLMTFSENFASDSSILRKLQKYNYGSKLFNSKEKDAEYELLSPTKEIARTPVTSSDPLGAMEDPNDEVQNQNGDHNEGVTVSNVETISLSNEMPILFRGSMHKSSTFEQESPNSGCKLQRSETIAVSNAVTTSLSNFGSSLKMNFSPRNLTGKKSNELLQEGLSSLKFAANSVVKKLDEIKEAITSTPSKNHNQSNNRSNTFFDTNLNTSSNTLAIVDYDSNDGSERSRKISSDINLNKIQLKDYENNPLLENLYKNCNQELSGDYDIEIVITSCSECHNCLSLLYDEDIMANWTADDSNLNTICQSCNKSTVPLLTICILKSNFIDEPFRIPYLNPLVLRKELENILINEGDTSLSKSDFIDKHPIIYWNLLWTFERIGAKTFFPNLYCDFAENKNQGHQNSENNVTEDSKDSHPLTCDEEDSVSKTTIIVRCLWDDPRIHSKCLPLYFVWQKGELSNFLLNSLSNEEPLINRSSVQSIIGSILCGDFQEPIKQLLTERERRIEKGDHQDLMKSISVYREMVFLLVKAVGQSKINLVTFDREYLLAFERLLQDNEFGHLFKSQDRPINVTSILCRQYFRPLTLP